MEFLRNSLDENCCDCKIEHEFDFVVMAGEKEESMQQSIDLLKREFERIFEITKIGSAWRLTDVNFNRELCTTYPKILVSHKDTSDDVLKKDSSFRKRSRFPTPVWYCKKTGASLIRGSQPDTFGLYGGTQGAETDEENLQSLFSTSSKLPIILDCRPQTNAWANLFNHGGTESLLYEYEVQFMNIPNVQGVSHGLKILVENNSKDIWFQNMDSVIKAAVAVAEHMKEGRSVFVHCSDGWDRTTQVISLAQILLDPYCRTLEGFYILIEKEWVNFGHMFSLRTDNGKLESANVEWSPIFAQWLNIIWWYMYKYPNTFEFKALLLDKLLLNTYNPKLYSGTDVPNLWDMVSNAPFSLDEYRNGKYDATIELPWDSTPIDKLWEMLYFTLVQPHTERKVKKRLDMRRSNSDGNFSHILTRFLQDTVDMLQEYKGEEKAVPSQYAAHVSFLIEGEKSSDGITNNDGLVADRDFWRNIIKQGKDLFQQQEGILHGTFELTKGKKGHKLQSYSVFKTRRDAEISVELNKKFIQECGLHNHLVLETTHIIPV